MRMPERGWSPARSTNARQPSPKVSNTYAVGHALRAGTARARMADATLVA